MKILLAIDGSRFGDEAVRFCEDLFGPHENAEIKVLSVIQRLAPLGAAAAAGAAPYYSQMQNFSVDQAKEFVGKAAGALREALSGKGFEITEEVLTGSISREIVRTAEEWGADLVVVGSHGYGYWERTLLGSVSDSVVHLAPCSVLIVRFPGEPPATEE
ncbi:MAG: universal stress protein [Acidobacteriota bacterium]|nr:MAG: universal stress protein [Acidobacteriota bacterium]